MPDSTHYLYRELYERLRNDEDLFKWFEQGATDGMWYWDLTDPEHEWLSPNFKKLFGYAEDEIPHTSAWWQEHIFKEDLPGVLDNFEKHKADPNHPYDQIVRYRHKTGKTIWVRCRGQIIRDDNGEPARMLGAHTDLTALMETRLQLERTSQNLRLTLDETQEINQLALSTTDIGTWQWDLRTNKLTWDDALYALHGLTPDKGTPMTYERWQQYVHPEDMAGLENSLERTLSGEASLRTMIRIRLDDGTIRYLKSAGDVFYDSDGEPVRVRGVSWDITEEKLREQELERSNKDLETFAYVASHDLKAPLRGIRQLANWIIEDIETPSPQVNEHIELMETRIGRLEHLLDDLLAYSRAGRALEDVQKESVCTRALVKETFESLGGPTSLTLVECGDFPELLTYRSALSQMLINLFSNAIKHRSQDDSQIAVCVTQEGGEYRFSIADKNPAIEARYRERIFEMFQTLKPRDKVEGSGMGLAIARRIVHQLGSQLELESAPRPTGDPLAGYQNIFSFTWPAEHRA